METDPETMALCEGVSSGMKSSFCDSKMAAGEQVHMQSNPQMKQDKHTHLLDPGSKPGSSYSLGHDNQLGCKHTSCVLDVHILQRWYGGCQAENPGEASCKGHTQCKEGVC